MSFSKLVRFEKSGEIYYGDLLKHDASGFLVKTLNGNLTNGFTGTNSEPVLVQTVRTFTSDTNVLFAHEYQLLCPLEHTVIIYCVGLNYRDHAAAMKVRTYYAHRHKAC